MSEREVIPSTERQRLDRSIQATAVATARDELFRGAARLHAGLERALALAHSGAAWGSPLALQYGQAFAAYLEQHGLHTYVARRENSRYSLELTAHPSASAGADGSLVTLVFLRELRVEQGCRDEPLVYHQHQPGGFTLMSALEHGWAAVLDDLHPGCEP